MEMEHNFEFRPVVVDSYGGITKATRDLLEKIDKEVVRRFADPPHKYEGLRLEAKISLALIKALADLINAKYGP